METKDTAVALLKEWKRMADGNDFLKMQRSEPLLNAHNDFVVVQDISRRLDEIVEAAGIILKDGYFMYSDINAHYDFGRFDVRFRISGGTLPAREQQAIQEWLLIKNEEKTA